MLLYFQKTLDAIVHLIFAIITLLPYPQSEIDIIFPFFLLLYSVIPNCWNPGRYFNAFEFCLVVQNWYAGMQSGIGNGVENAVVGCEI